MMKKFFSLLMILLLLLIHPVNVINAGEEEPDDEYQVTIYGGMHGKISDSEGSAENVKVIFTVKKGTVINLNPDTGSYGDRFSVTPEGKYLFKGYHISGQLDESNLDKGQFAEVVFPYKVDHDVDFVATYYVPGNIVHYKATYVDTDGNTLHAPDEYVGNLGYKPVVSFRYIEGYVPNAHNITGTLTKDNMEFKFTYTTIPGSGGGAGGEEVTYIYEEIPGGGGGTGGGGASPVTPTIPEPEQIIDIDNNPTPLAPGGDNNTDGNGGNEPTEPIEPEQVPTTSFWQTLLNNPLLLVSGGILTFGLLAFIIFLLMRRRREDD